MSMKILSPAGDMESLRMAVFNGADEVYLGIKDFNARNIEGFSLETLKDAIEFAHIFNVKVNLTVNILFSDAEMQSVLDLVINAYNLGVDSFIIQDVGLASLIHEHYPKIEMHASTQMGIHNLEGVLEVEKLGFKRVVLARETPLEEIKRIRESSSIEIEYFCQGALCVSFSGNCYLSSYLHDASGNRGKCKQLCRLPYSFRLNNKEIKNGYLLSAKDFNMLENLKDLEDAGVDVLKIEGRARRPYYVGIATRVYKQALNGEKYNIEDLMLGFNRDYTAGYFNGNGEIISNKQNHVGIKIGKVEKFKIGKKFNEIFITSDREISTKSVLKFINGNDEVVVATYDIQKVGSLFRITTTQKVSVTSEVHLISDFAKEQQLFDETKRKKVEIKITAKENLPIQAEFNLRGEYYVVEGEVCASAKSQPITEEDLKANFNKSDLLEVGLKCELENVFLTKKSLNEFRRNVLEKIKEILIKDWRSEKNKINLNLIKNNKKINKFNNFIEIFNNFHEFFENDLKIKEKNVIYFPNEYNFNNIKEFISICEKHNKKPILNLPIFALREDVELLRDIVEKTKVAVIVNNLYALSFNTEKIVGGGLNVYNSYTANYFNLPYIQAEGEDYQMPYMTLRHCPMKSHLNTNCNNCHYKEGYEYVMQNGRRFKLRRIKLSSCTFELREGTK